jgi:hypothetical protein
MAFPSALPRDGLKDSVLLHQGSLHRESFNLLSYYIKKEAKRKEMVRTTVLANHPHGFPGVIHSQSHSRLSWRLLCLPLPLHHPTQ